MLYPLTDYKPRKAENVERGYLQGRYGAIPFLGDFCLAEEFVGGGQGVSQHAATAATVTADPAGDRRSGNPSRSSSSSAKARRPSPQYFEGFARVFHNPRGCQDRARARGPKDPGGDRQGVQEEGPRRRQEGGR